MGAGDGLSPEPGDRFEHQGRTPEQVAGSQMNGTIAALCFLALMLLIAVWKIAPYVLR